MIPMDPTLIEQVLINLMENALIHSGSTEPVDLIIRELDDAISFSVRDYGRGLSEDLLPHIFEGGQVSSGSSDSTEGWESDFPSARRSYRHTAGRLPLSTIPVIVQRELNLLLHFQKKRRADNA